MTGVEIPQKRHCAAFIKGDDHRLNGLSETINPACVAYPAIIVLTNKNTMGLPHLEIGRQGHAAIGIGHHRGFHQMRAVQERRQVQLACIARPIALHPHLRNRGHRPAPDRGHSGKQPVRAGLILDRIAKGHGDLAWIKDIPQACPRHTRAGGARLPALWALREIDTVNIHIRLRFL